MAFAIPKTTPLSQPCWLREQSAPGMFRVAGTKLIGQPENPPPFSIEYVFEAGGRAIIRHSRRTVGNGVCGQTDAPAGDNFAGVA